MIEPQVTSERKLIVIVAAFLLVLWSCTQQKSPEPVAEGAMDSTSEAHRIWKTHERMLTDILDGHEFNESDFTTAVDFFVRTTSIPSQDSGTYVARIPNAQLSQDLERWKAWYVENAPFLKLDAGEQRIVVDEDAKRRTRVSG